MGGDAKHSLSTEAQVHKSFAWAAELEDDREDIFGKPEHLAKEKEFFDLYEAAMATPGLLEENSQLIYSAAFNRVLAWSGSKLMAFERVYPAVEKAFAKSTLSGYLKGAFYNSYAWDARGTDNVEKIPADDWVKIQDRLRVAHAALETAYELDPSDPLPPAVMVSVSSTVDQPNEEMETWFRRAMAADPGNVKACQMKLNYLLPRWGGSHEEMLKFGLECATNNPDYSTGVPFMLMEVHLAIAKDEGDDTDTYFSDREVWDELKELYEGAAQGTAGKSAVFVCEVGTRRCFARSGRRRMGCISR